MATKKTTAAKAAENVEEKKTTAAEKKAEAKAANEKAKAARKEANKKSAEAAKEAIKEAAQDAADKAATATKNAAKKTADAAKATATKVAEDTKKAVEEKKAGTAAKKRVRKPAKTVILQFAGEEYSEEELTERAIAQFAATEAGVSVKKITMYLKPEDRAAYYVINDQYTGQVNF